MTDDSSAGEVATARPGPTIAWRRVGSLVAISLIAFGLLYYSYHLFAGLYFQQVAQTDDKSAAAVRMALRDFSTVVQLEIVLLFVFILGAIAQRYFEPYFILWLYGWIMWLGLYASRQHGWPELPFNALNSFFFLFAGLVLNDWEWFARFKSKAPIHTPKKRLIAILAWVFFYLWRNWRATVLIGVWVGVVYALEPNTRLGRYVEGGFAVISIGVFGVGLFRRFKPISRDTAWAALCLHLTYLWPQLAKMSPWVGDVNSYQYLYAVGLPSLVLKPALALFVAQLALREARAVSDATAQREKELRGRNQPDESRLSVFQEVIEKGTESDTRRLGNIVNTRLEKLFAGDEAYHAFATAFYETIEARIGCVAQVRDASRKVFTAHLIVEKVRPGGRMAEQMWISVATCAERADECLDVLKSTAPEDTKYQAFQTLLELPEGWWGSTMLMTFLLWVELDEAGKLGQDMPYRWPENLVDQTLARLYYEAPTITTPPKQWLEDALRKQIRGYVTVH